jgi:small-conductance mechanosensitive channel
MDLTPIRITAPKSAPWITSETSAATQAHNSTVDACAAELAQLVTDRAAYEATDFSVADVQQLARDRQAMLIRTLTWHQSVLAAIRARTEVCKLIVADSRQELCKASERLQERRQTVASTLAAIGLDAKTAPADPEAERLDGQVRALRSVGPSLTPNNGNEVAKIKSICTEALRRAMLSGLPQLPDGE